MDVTAVRAAILARFQNVTELGGGLLRGERLHEGRPFAVAYVDISDNIVGRADELRTFQERLLGEQFFSSENQIRWNNYVYLVAGSASLQSNRFKEAKARIEANRDYARKFVVSEKDLLDLLADSRLFASGKDIETADIMRTWQEILATSNLGFLLEKPPRTKALEMIAQGQVSQKIASSPIGKLWDGDEDLADATLLALELTRCRDVHDGQRFEFGDVNLIVGPNGSGKTTLLEAIEYFYCGKNRRGDVPYDFRLVGTIRVGNESAVNLGAPAEPARIKARNLAWYRKDDPQSRGILTGFTRCNFLDTDAAFRISTDIDTHSLEEDLERLLVGADASTLWDYLRKFADELKERANTSRESLQAESTRCELLSQELRRLRSAPSERSAAIKTYRSLLQQVGWRSLPPLDAPLGETERSSLERAARCVWTMRAASPVTADKFSVKFEPLVQNLREFHFGIEPPLGPVVELVSGLRGLVEEVKRLDSVRSESDRSLAAKSNELKTVERTLELLSEWLGYCEVGVPTQLATLHQARAELGSLRELLGQLGTARAAGVPEEYRSLSVDAAQRRASDAQSDIAASARGLQAKLKALEDEKETHVAWFLQLREAAQELVRRSATPGDCPVCGTHHRPEDLAVKINSLVGISSAGQTEEVRRALEEVRNQETQLGQMVSTLTVQVAFCRRLKLPIASTELRVVIERFERSQKAMQQSVEAQQSAESALNNLHLIGMSVSRYSELRDMMAAALPKNVDIENAAALSLERTRLATQRDEFNSQIQNLRALFDDAVSSLLVIGSDVFGDSDAGTAVSEVAPRIQARFDDFKTRLHAAQQLQELIDLPEPRSLSDLDDDFSRLVEAYDRAAAAVITERAAGGSLDEQARQADAALKALSDKQGELQRLDRAYQQLLGLLEKHSLDAATRDTLTAIREQVNDVFCRIHSPREYEFVGSADALLQTRETKSPRTLDQISTGQRSAFALAIFLALSSTARSAPRVLLIDDPVAHIDDLNALSFLDYLRDLALRTRRQIFFATADTRFAALFDKKFEFLGSTHFRRIALPQRIVA
jgi:DNA repair protein SbcC/Rad50